MQNNTKRLAGVTPATGDSSRRSGDNGNLLVCSVFGTRPEVIKFAPVIRQLELDGFRTLNISSAQHRDLIRPLVEHFKIRVDHDLDVMQPGQTLNSLVSRVVDRLDPVFVEEEPSVVLVQGDTTTAMSGALAAWNRRIPVGHLEAGLRTDTADNPFPEEMNRRLISRLATHHFAGTQSNYDTLISEGVDPEAVVITGNPVIDALEWTLHENSMRETEVDLPFPHDPKKKLIVLTTHRRESFGKVMFSNLKVIRDFLDAHEDVELVFPVHPNPNVKAVAATILEGRDRVHLIDPMDYPDFLNLLSHAWLLVSDSGGLQEEAPSLGKPLLVMRENTERPEAVECGAAKLTGSDPEVLRRELEAAYTDDSWTQAVEKMVNPFGTGDAAKRVSEHLAAQGSLVLEA